MKQTDDPWAPYEPSESDPWDLPKVAHLHRRAGFGATWAELHRDLADGPSASVDRFLHPPDASDDERQVIDGLARGAVDARDARRLRAAWLYRMLFGADPLRERLTLFWHGHFATSLAKVDSVRAMADQVETLRTHALGPFAPLLEAVTADPAMLAWLDGGTSKRDQPNENYAREFLELFTLGPGPYSEADIREAARAFTGWAPDRGRRSSMGDDPAFTFDPAKHDDGPKTFLGQAGPWKAADVVRIALDRPEAAAFLARKLDRAFVAEDAEPPAEVIAPLADALRRNHFNIHEAIALILRSRRFFSADAYRRRIKSPVDYVAGLARSLQIPRERLSLLALATACGRQGQELFAPPSVKGWDGGATWINSTTLLERLNWASDVVWGNADAGVAPFDPLAWAGANGIAPEDVAASLVRLLVQDDLAADARGLVLEPSAEPDAAQRSLQRLLHAPEVQLA